MIKFKIILILTALAIITAIPAMAQISNGDDDVNPTTVDAGSSSTLGNIFNGGDDDVSSGSVGGDTGNTNGDITNGDDDTTGGNTGGNIGDTEGDITNGDDDTTGGNTGGDTGDTDGDITNGDDDTTGGNTGGDTGDTDGDITNGDDDTTGGNTGGDTGDTDGDITNGDDDTTGGNTGDDTDGDITNGDDDDTNNGGTPGNNGGETTNPSNTSRRSGGGSRNRNTIALENTGNVNTISTINASCPLITAYMRRGGNNDAVEVAKLQMFLRNEGVTVPVTGIFDANTETAVNIFQKKYQTSILGPWDASIPSGMVYITTKNKINEIACNQISVLTPQQLSIIAQFIKNRDQGNNVIPTPSLDFGVSTTTNDTNLASDDFNSDNTDNTAAVENAPFIKRFWNFLTGIFR